MDEKSSQVFVPDVLNRRDIISHFRDLIDMGPLLVFDWEEIMHQFRKKLHASGWDEENICLMIQIACSRSRFLSDLPRMPKDRGDWLEWIRNKSRLK